MLATPRSFKRFCTRSLAQFIGAFARFARAAAARREREAYRGNRHVRARRGTRGSAIPGKSASSESYSARVRLPRRRPFRHMPQLHPQDRGLQFVQPAVPAALRAEILRRLAMIAQRAQPRGQLFVAGDDHSGVAVRAQIFAGIKAQAAEPSHRSGFAPAIAWRQRIARCLR